MYMVHHSRKSRKIYKKGGNCGCSSLFKGGWVDSASFNSTTVPNDSYYPYNGNQVNLDPNDTSQLQSSRLLPDMISSQSGTTIIPPIQKGGRRRRRNRKTHKKRRNFVRGGNFVNMIYPDIYNPITSYNGVLNTTGIINGNSVPYNSLATNPLGTLYNNGNHPIV